MITLPAKHCKENIFYLSIRKALARQLNALGRLGRIGQPHVVWHREQGQFNLHKLQFSSQTVLAFLRNVLNYHRRKPRRQCALVKQCNVLGISGAIGQLPVEKPPGHEQ